MIPASKRVLAIDYGVRWLGLAWSDPSLTIVAGSRTIDRKKTHVPVTELISDVVCEIGIGSIVVGMPYNMDGSAGSKARETQSFIDLLREKLDIPIYHWDERLTTVRAEEELKKLGGRKRKGMLDEMSASYILEAFLNRSPDTQDIS
ncbi:MAG: Holliday junction resolvase RuvX [Candidatus Glassbacteria bacterium]